jgi:hypothetical protein
MLITSEYIDELAKFGIDWSRLRDDHASGMSRHDIAQAAYLYILENPGKSASYAIAAVLADARRRAAVECEMPDELPEIAAVDDWEICKHHDVPPGVEAAAAVLRDGTAAAAAMLRCSRRRVQQLLARDPHALARRLASASQQGELFEEGV